MRFDFELVGKIGSMALIRREDSDIDYNIFARLGRELRPGMIWVSSGAVEIGRLDYLRRQGRELLGDPEEVKADYAAQGQAILMQEYRRCIRQARYKAAVPLTSGIKIVSWLPPNHRCQSRML